MTSWNVLITADEQRCRLLRIEWWTKQCQRLFGPILRRAVCFDTKIHMIRRNEHLVGVFETAGLDPVDPDRESFAERRACLGGRADKIGDHGAAGLDDAIAHPSHAACVLDAVVVAKAKVLRKIGAHRIGIEHDCVEERRRCGSTVSSCRLPVVP